MPNTYIYQVMNQQGKRKVIISTLSVSEICDHLKREDKGFDIESGDNTINGHPIEIVTASNPQYLFVTEGGESVFVIDGQPTVIDKQCVGQGMLTVVNLESMCELDQNGKWVPVQKGHLDKRDNYHRI